MASRSDRKKDSEKFQNTRPLLVEGDDDKFVIAEIANQYDVPSSFWIQTCGGKPRVLTKLDGLLKNDNFERLGVVVDADSDVQQRWREFKKVFLSYDIALPDVPNSDGTILTIEEQKIGVWLMPDNQNAGELEDLFQMFIPQSDDLVPYVNQSLDVIEEKKVHPYKSRPKAFVHTWLAWQEDSGVPMGRAISDYNLADTTAAKELAEWLSNLFTTDV